MKLVLATAAAIALLSGCSTIINDKTQQVNVSTPNNQKVTGTVNGQAFSAPGVVALVRENKSKVFVSDSPDCKGQTVAEKTVDPIFFVNILSGGAFGSTTDYASEKMWKYSENIVLSCNK